MSSATDNMLEVSYGMRDAYLNLYCITLKNKLCSNSHSVCDAMLSPDSTKQIGTITYFISIQKKADLFHFIKHDCKRYLHSMHSSVILKLNRLKLLNVIAIITMASATPYKLHTTYLFPAAKSIYITYYTKYS